jgi:hypothetical protein
MTLLEIVLACFLFLLCLGIITSTFSSSVRIYSKGNARLRAQQKMRVALDVLSSELRACYDTAIPPGGQLIIANPGPITGRAISFHKFDERKGGAIQVSYTFDPAAQTLTRQDFDLSGRILSTSPIADTIDDVTFTWDGATHSVNLRIAAMNPSTNNPDIIYETSIATRTGNDLLSVKAVGRKGASDTSSLIYALP